MRQGPHFDISLIVPVYGAEASLRRVLAAIDADLSRSDETWELLLVVDASPDMSEKICHEFAKLPHPYTVRVLSNEWNLGKGGSVKRGMLEARGQYRVFTDCDLAYPISEVRKIIKSLREGCDVVIASRVHEGSRYVMSPNDFHYLYTRHLASRIFNWVVNRITLPHCSDTQAGLKGFTAKAAEFLFSQQRLTGFSFDVELLYLAHRVGFSIKEIPILFYYREEQSTVDFFADALRLMRDLFRILYWAISGNYFTRSQSLPVRKLVVHADDFGLSEGINEGIVSAMKKGVVTSTSLLVNFPNSLEAMELAQKNSFDVGWHVNLTLGKPISPPEKVPSLVRPDGTFYPLKLFLRRAFLRQISEKDVAEELQAQWKLFSKADLEPTHVDGHQHVHLFPVVRDVVRDIVHQKKIPFVRIPHEQGGIGTPRLLTRCFLKILKGGKRSFWQQGEIQSISFFGLSVAFSGNLFDSWKSLLCRIQAPVAEVMVHPGRMKSGENLYGDDFKGDREKEWQLLMSPEWQSMIHAIGFQSVSFRDLAGRGYWPIAEKEEEVLLSIEPDQIAS
ncbi:MAG: ChbG/HpnK family deacetylase [Deltaproteobacteria bacterium]|nr:ChbG/HpnK family deacetylase [Deltaproteobacteria bacterium]